MLNGKTAVITGCLQGIGRCTMDLFASNNASVFACCQYETEEFSRHIAEISGKLGVEIIPVYFDMSDNAAIKSAAIEIQKKKKSIDVLVNIAGINKDALFQMVTYDDLQATFQVNFFSQIIFSQYIVKLMQKNNGGGSIINTASISGLDGNKGQLAYAASKSALVAATKTMAVELGEKRIRVNAIAPGVIDTNMTSALASDVTAKKINRSKLKRKGLPEEVASTILFLASDMSEHITGQVIRIDGGIA
ncbi:3-oxoacyl-ACP reductase [Synergistales bacterium]|nr:3-oxoacyl-ACP reductase [Synergistales bacterium]